MWNDTTVGKSGQFGEPSLCQLLPISLRIDVMTSFQSEVVANNGNGLSVGILASVNFTGT